jgi:hypothetical protein
MKFGDLLDQAKHLVVEDDPDAKPASKPAPVALHPHPAFSATPAVSPSAFAAAPAPSMSGSPFSVPAATVVDEGVYQAILKKTDFSATPVGRAVQKYYDSLEGIIADPAQRTKSAVAQAQKLENITPQQVLDTFDSLSTALDQDARGFQGVADTVEKNQITAVQDDITRLDQQIAQLTAQRTQKASDLANNQASHANAVTQYGLASQRRTQEIAAQKQQFAALLR